MLAGYVAGYVSGYVAVLPFEGWAALPPNPNFFKSIDTALSIVRYFFVLSFQGLPLYDTQYCTQKVFGA